ncbi:substrate-binding domain-containing protein [Kineococcus sp. GCM10028916]|uniref:substrate-binding domain-containing protein n=1 Tax=Kineococcus sp. GCM10028916 TaxID=3273394 RepID=UPI0036349921
MIKVLGRRRTRTLTTLVLLAATGTLTACSDGPATASTAGSASTASPHIAFLAEKTSLRYEASDVPNFQIDVAKSCPGCTVDVYFASTQDEQNQQASKALSDGATVLVVAPKDSEGAAAIAQQATSGGAKVISYDSLIKGSAIDAFVTFDSGKVGAIGAQAVLDAEPAPGAVVVELDGDAGNSNAAWVASGAKSVLDGKITTGFQAWVPEWSADNAEIAMEQAIQQLHGTPIAGVVGANDSIAKGAAKALREAGWTGTLPPISGQDADVAAMQRLLTGEQAVTAYKPMPQLAAAAADMALALGRGEAVTTTTTTDNGAGAVPTTLLQPTAVTASNLATTVIADEFTTVEALCAGSASQACVAAGLRS